MVLKKMCPSCGKVLENNHLFCPDCRATGEVVDESKLGRKNTLNKEIYNFLNNKFDEVYAVGHQNVSGIDLYDERCPPKELIKSRWIKESSCVVLKDEKPYLSIEMKLILLQ